MSIPTHSDRLPRGQEQTPINREESVMESCEHREPGNKRTLVARTRHGRRTTSAH